ncbi:Cyclin, N-terminal domain [Popillia japonica]|uniref:Cyclin, N-terminal domain n=1 Tax=Popillia japonica TaxID=7064 RepID=A0AAW1MF79_POPJA
MDLVCFERLTENKAIVDPTLLDKKVLENLLEEEETSQVTFCDIQNEITIDMRKIVMIWMKEVTEEQKCQLEVFLLAVNYMNRFLNICQVRRNQLQLLGTACLLIASKLRESTPLTAKLLIFYTDNSITLCELLQFEQLILSKLKWNIAIVTPLDFLQHLVLKISIVGTLRCTVAEVDERAKALISYCACEYVFWKIPPSLIAASCIASALLAQVRRTSYNSRQLFNLFGEICKLTHIEMDSLQIHQKYVDNMIERARRAMAGETTEQSDYAAANSDSRKNNEFTTPPLDDKSLLLEIETATTPTDVHNIDF